MSELKSYPYLDIALRHGVDYGKVLRFSDCLEGRIPLTPEESTSRPLPMAVQAEIIDLNADHDRRWKMQP